MFDERGLRGIAEYKIHTHWAIRERSRRGNGLLAPTESDSVGVRERNADFIITIFFFL